MKESKFTEEQITYAIRQVEAGKPTTEMCRKLGISDEQTFAEFKRLISNSEKVIQRMAATARTAHSPLADSGLARLTARKTLEFESVRREPTILYISVPEYRVRYYGFLLRILWTKFFDACMDLPEAKNEARSIFAIKDEAGNVAAIPDFPSLMTTLRGRKVSVSLLLQDAEQLTTRYGSAGASTIINGATSSRIFLPGLSHDTCRQVEDMLRKQTIREGRRRETRSLLTADEIRTSRRCTSLEGQLVNRYLKDKLVDLVST